MLRGTYERTPEHRTVSSKARKGVPRKPEHIVAIKEGVRNSEAAKAHTESMCGGNDIVNHHYIYDESDLSKYMMKMTRSRHTRLHRLMKKAGIEIPHINMVEK